jgi:hypothetical protein
MRMLLFHRHNSEVRRNVNIIKVDRESIYLPRRIGISAPISFGCNGKDDWRVRGGVTDDVINSFEKICAHKKGRPKATL